ncbi:ubiquitin-like protein [Fadolivirus algeromassiliense]|jgi:hypothetical protein|uniref:Ubiquitin-like protein n=1 Tax=Fadolivirus FV1/VV64 TaxID=3070911 RepID=A0A7D3UV29_9VIRU|nr:ubiquitin-like protein [Fadolivirus algeromassiliense]QKF93849.1 ubiquitin-like protein [Fadolivirus FV1/VV64]
MQVFIKGYNSDDRTFVLEVDHHITYNDLKELIGKRKGFSIDSFQLMYCGKYIESSEINDKTLQELDITENSTLYFKPCIYPKVILKN